MMTAAAVSAPPRLEGGVGRFACGASRIGLHHRRVGKNNQDGWALATREARTVGVVTDGCGSRRGSEVGAQLGAHYLAAYLAKEPWSHELPLRATDAICRWLSELSSRIDPSAPHEVLDRHFLFTFLAVVKEGRRTLVFGLGDGATVVDGAASRIDPGPDNAPEYCAYRLTSVDSLEPRVHFAGDADVVAVMTDGFDPLLAQKPGVVAGLYEGALGWKNPFALERRLNVLSEAERLADDATLVVVGGT